MTAPTPEPSRTAPLVSSAELAEYLGQSVREGRARTAARVAQGWVREALGMADAATWPDPVPEGLWAGVLELAASAYDNPLGQAGRNFGEEGDTLVVTHRAGILDRLRRRYAVGDAAAADGPVAPVGQFPPPARPVAF